MEISQLVSVSSKQFYAFLLDSLKEDYQVARQEDIDPSDLKPGLTFQKKFGKRLSNAVNVTVVDLVENERYALAFKSSRGTQWLSYQLEDAEEGACQVTYSEDFSPQGRLNKWNYNLLLPLMRKSLEARMRLQIEKIAEFAKNKEDLIHG